MNGLELIRHRRSVRTFDGRPLSAEDTEKILRFAQDVTNPYDIPITFKIFSAGDKGLSSPVIVGADTYLAGKLRRVPHAEEAFGFAFEKLVLYAESLGIGTTWIAGTMDRPAFERAMELSDGEVMPCVSPLGYPAPKMSIRETMMRKGVRADSRKPFGELFFDRGFDAPLAEDAALPETEALQMVRLAPSAVIKQPWRVVLDGDSAHFYEQRSKGYVDASGWDLQKVDMGIALFHYACGLDGRVRLALRDPRISAPEGVFYVATLIRETSDGPVKG